MYELNSKLREVSQKPNLVLHKKSSIKARGMNPFYSTRSVVPPILQKYAAPHRIPLRVWLHNLRESMAEYGLTLSDDERFVYISGEGNQADRHIHIDLADDGADLGQTPAYMQFSLILPKGRYGDQQDRPHLEAYDTDNWVGSVATFPQATRNVVALFRDWFLAHRYQGGN